MTYVAPNAAAAANKASRLRKKIREGKAIASADRAWLDTYGRGRVATPAAAPAPAPAPAPVHREPVAAPTVSASPEPTAAPSRDAFTVIDFGQPQTPMAIAEAPKVCQIPGCTHSPREHTNQRCGITGEKYYPPLRPNSGKAAANVGFAVIGFFIALAKGIDEAPEPTDEEVNDLSDAVRDIVARRAPELGAYDDLLAGGYAISAYSIRAARTPKGGK